MINNKIIFKTWWPLALSWLFMSIELPMISAVMARMVDPKIHLAAYGGVVFPISLIIEAPIIMLLSASTSLSKDWASYKKMYAFMMWSGGILTLLHAVVAFTPVYDVVIGWMKPPEEIIEPARIGLMIMLPWTWTIAYRRFHQGVLIRYGLSKAISIGTFVRLAANALAMAIGAIFGGLPGIVIGTLGIAAGVTAEAIYTGYRVQTVLKTSLRNEPTYTPALTWNGFFAFYIPLILVSLLNLLVQPIGSLYLSRMPLALESLALWPVLGGFLFLFRSLGFAYNEVVIALMDKPGAREALRNFAYTLSGILVALMLVLTATPLSAMYFTHIAGIDADLINLARSSLWIALLWPALSVIQNWLQGSLVYGKKTSGITESVVILLVVCVVIFSWGAWKLTYPGIYVGLAGFLISGIFQSFWMWYRGQTILKYEV